MAQLNVNVTPEFEKALKRLMKARGIATKSDAVRLAVIETAEREAARKPKADVYSLVGAALRVGEENPNPRFTNDDDIWE